MSYIVQQPNSNTNPTNRYRVVEFEKFMAFLNGNTTHIPVESEHDSYASANHRRNTLNGTNE